MSSVRLERGLMPNTKAKYEFYLPTITTMKFPCVILIHGFQGKIAQHRGTAILLAQANIACLVIQMLPLMSIYFSTLPTLRQNNVYATISYLDWLNERKEIDQNLIMLAGYSAGGAVALETAAMVTQKPGRIRGVLLLDAVP
jgi:dienelactone hydrolase